MKGTVSLVIAVTGHRDLHPDYVSEYQKQVVEILRTLKDRHPHTPLLLLSGLADGADRVAVYAAQQVEIPYVAVLPMPKSEYRKDFTPESAAEFDRLLGDRVIELPVAQGQSLSEIQKGGPARDRQYRELGGFLVRYSQILIALWDDQFTGKVGGTSDVVKMKLGQIRSAERSHLMPSNFNGAGPVYVIPAVRAGSPRPQIPALRCEQRYPAGRNGKDYEKIYGLLDEYNADVACSQNPAFEKAVRQSRKFLFEGGEAVGLSPAMEWVATVYAYADTLALRCARFSLRILHATFGLLGLSGVMLAWLHVFEGGDPVLLGYYVCLIAGAGLLIWETRSGRRKKHEDYRALAEALRVQFFWMAAGLSDLAAEQYLLKHAGEMVWIREAISECGLHDPVAGLNAPVASDLPMRLRLAHTWVRGQANYFSGKQTQYRRRRRFVVRLAQAGAALGLIAPIAAWLAPRMQWPAEAEIVRWSHATAAVALWLAALLWNYIERRGFEQEEKEYARMFDLFCYADEQLEKYELAKDFDSSVETIRELGRAALEENGDWLAMHRERKLSPHNLVG